MGNQLAQGWVSAQSMRESEGGVALGARSLRVPYDRSLRELEVCGQMDVDWMHRLALGAGQKVPALRYGLIAAERALPSRVTPALRSAIGLAVSILFAVLTRHFVPRSDEHPLALRGSPCLCRAHGHASFRARSLQLRSAQRAG